MRKNSARKWLHATLDLLPVIIIPLFAIFMHRHDAPTYEVEVRQNEVVDFNQLYEFRSTGSTVNNGVTYTYSGYYLSVVGTADSISTFTLMPNTSFTNNHKYIIYGNGTSSYTGNGFYFNVSGITVGNNTVFTYNSSGNLYYRVYNGVSVNIGMTLSVFDLSKMFGVGNEPTAEQFSLWYPNNFYEYTLSRKELLKDVSTVTYNNTDIGSQLVYALYTPINDYMNFNNVFNFGAIYDWLQLNIFNGNAPLSIFIVWNIFLYEFLMDLIFLLYALFMFFIDFCTNLIDRFHCKASGGH